MNYINVNHLVRLCDGWCAVWHDQVLNCCMCGPQVQNRTPQTLLFWGHGSSSVSYGNSLFVMWTLSCHISLLPRYTLSPSSRNLQKQSSLDFLLYVPASEVGLVERATSTISSVCGRQVSTAYLTNSLKQFYLFDLQLADQLDNSIKLRFY